MSIVVCAVPIGPCGALAPVGATHLCTLETEWIDVCFATILEYVEVITPAYSYSLGSTIHNYLHFTLLLCKNVNVVTMALHNVSYNIISHHSRKTPFAVGYEAAHSFISYALLIDMTLKTKLRIANDHWHRRSVNHT